MTRIGIDPEDALQTVRALAQIKQDINSTTDRIHGPGWMALTPPRPLHYGAKIDHVKHQLNDHARETGEVGARLAETQIKLMVALGEGDSPVLGELIGYAVSGGDGTIDLEDVGGAMDALSAIWGPASTVLDLREAVAMGLVLTSGRWTGESLKTLRGSKQWGKGWDKYLSRHGLGVITKLGPAFKALAFKSSYDSSSARTPVARSTSAAIAGAVSILKPLALADGLTGGTITAVMDEYVVLGEALITWDASGVEQFSQDMVSGKKGWFMQTVGGYGEMISHTVTGDTDDWSKNALDGKYGAPLQVLSKGGDAIGGWLYDRFT